MNASGENWAFRKHLVEIDKYCQINLVEIDKIGEMNLVGACVDALPRA